jgi:hypothetical protein
VRCSGSGTQISQADAAPFKTRFAYSRRSAVLIALPYEWRHEIFTVEGDFTQAQVGMVDAALIDARVNAWLPQFAGAEHAILSA